MPMPIDLQITTNKGASMYYVPLRMMRKEKPNTTNYTQLEDWPWTHPTYTFTVDVPMSKIKSMTIDPSTLMADIARENNEWRN
jgi:hypothetical protein